MPKKKTEGDEEEIKKLLIKTTNKRQASIDALQFLLSSSPNMMLISFSPQQS
jgi:hypothetical protein